MASRSEKVSEGTKVEAEKEAEQAGTTPEDTEAARSAEREAGEPVSGDELEPSGEVAVETGPRLVALRSKPEPDAPEVGVPVGGQVAREHVWAEIVIAGAVTPTFQLVASEGLVVNPADLAALPARRA